MSVHVRLLPILERFARRGDVVRLPVPGSWWLLNDPALVRTVLEHDGSGVVKGAGNDALRPLVGGGVFLAEGDDWRAKRTAVIGALRKDALPDHAALVAAHTERMLDRWQSAAVEPAVVRAVSDESDGGVIDVYPELRAMLTGLFGEMLLGTRAFSDGDERAAVARAALGAAWDEAVRRAFAWTRRLPSPKGADAIRLVRAIASEAAVAASAARPSPAVGHTAMATLAAARRPDRAPVYDASTLTDEAVTLALAGQECAALSIAWTLALLGAHPEAAAHVVEEVDAVLAGRAPTDVDTSKLPRVRAAVHEALRLYPPAWILSRETTKPLALGRHTLPAGATILMSPYLVQRAARSFDEPLAFRPERFEHALDARGRAAFMPFGAGPRACVGTGLATMLAMTIVPRVLQRFTLSTTALPGVDAALTLHPRGPLRVHLAARA